MFNGVILPVARGLLLLSAQDLSYLPDPFCIRVLILCSRQEVFLFTFSRKLDMFFKLPIMSPPSRSSLILSFLCCFFVCKTGALPRNAPCQSPSVKGGIVLAVRTRHESLTLFSWNRPLKLLRSRIKEKSYPYSHNPTPLSF